MSLMEAALAYCERGWSVFPLHDKRRPCIEWKQYQSERASREQIIAWWTQFPDAHIGVALGQISGIVRVDADGDGYAELERLGGCGETAEFRSPSGGRGWLFRCFEGLTTKVVWSGQGEHNELRLQSDGAYTVLPPSPGYEWLNDLAPGSAPRWVLDYYASIALKQLERELRPTTRAPDKSEVEAALDVLPADTYDQWVQVGMALHSAGDEYLQVWDEWSKKSTKYKTGECQRKWSTFIQGGLTTRSILYWAEAYGYKPLARHEPLTELGNARILARLAEGRAKHSDKWGWLVWDGKRWNQEQAEKLVVEMQKEVLEYRLSRAFESLQKLLREGSEAPDYDRRRKAKVATIVQIRKHEDERSIRGARKLAESEPSLTCNYRDFDKDPWILNCDNGSLNLRSGELIPHDPEMRISQLCPTVYDPTAECPRWMQFVNEVFAGDADLIRWVQKLLGYALTGVIAEHVLPIFHGTGRNGKSTLIKAVQNVLGSDYSGTTPSGFLMQSRHDQHPTRLVTLYGKRFMADLETRDGANLDEELVKRLTGGDEIRARRMHENFWEFRPTHKLVVGTNYEPRIKGMDIAIWSRIKLVPFTQTFDGDKKDVHLEAKLLAESSGILRWMVDGCFMWQREGLGDTPAVSNATNSYKGEQDTVATFFRDRMEKCDGGRVKLADVASAYKGWCMTQSVEPVSSKTLKAGLRDLGVQLDATGRYYEGYKV